MNNLLLLLATAFNVWMIVDAIRRRAAFYWYLIILFVPFGAMIYYVMVKARDLRFEAAVQPAKIRAKPVEKPSLQELRTRALEVPSVQNKIELADALTDAAQYQEAVPFYEQVLRTHSANKEALHGLGICKLELGEPAEAAEYLTRLMDLDPRYRAFAGALDYAEALWKSGQKELALEVAQQLSVESGRLNHRLAYAHYLQQAGDASAARGVIEQAIDHYQQSPEFVRQRDRSWVRKAQQMLRELA